MPIAILLVLYGNEIFRNDSKAGRKKRSFRLRRRAKSRSLRTLTAEHARELRRAERTLLEFERDRDLARTSIETIENDLRTRDEEIAHIETTLAEAREEAAAKHDPWYRRTLIPADEALPPIDTELPRKRFDAGDAPAKSSGGEAD